MVKEKWKFLGIEEPTKDFPNRAYVIFEDSSGEIEAMPIDKSEIEAWKNQKNKTFNVEIEIVEHDDSEYDENGYLIIDKKWTEQIVNIHGEIHEWRIA